MSGFLLILLNTVDENTYRTWNIWKQVSKKSWKVKYAAHVAALSFKRYWYASPQLVRVGITIGPYKSYRSLVILGWKWEQRGVYSRSQLKKHYRNYSDSKHCCTLPQTRCYKLYCMLLLHSLTLNFLMPGKHTGGNNLMQFCHLRYRLPNESAALWDGTSSGRFHGSPLSADFRTCIRPPFRDPECHLLHYCCLMTAAALLSFCPEGFCSSGTCHSSGYGFNEINILTLSSPHR